jgi:hypothetical protein
MSPVWVGDSSTVTRNTTYDFGKTFNHEEERVMFGCFFFLDEEMETHNRDIVTVIDVFAQLGGFTKSIMVIIRIFMWPINVS